jgi:hypothetical protein
MLWKTNQILKWFSTLVALCWYFKVNNLQVIWEKFRKENCFPGLRMQNTEIDQKKKKNESFLRHLNLVI